jgi:AraC-like DNA-binding protein
LKEEFYRMNDEIFIRKAVEIVWQRIDDHSFRREEFARNMNVSSSLLYKKIKSLTMLSPTDFIKSIRLDYAVELLNSGEYSVTEISERIGFSSPGYFSTVFTKNYGMPPSQMLTKQKKTIDLLQISRENKVGRFCA